jgi:hypothetical protein
MTSGCRNTPFYWLLWIARSNFGTHDDCTKFPSPTCTAYQQFSEYKNTSIVTLLQHLNAFTRQHDLVVYTMCGFTLHKLKKKLRGLSPQANYTDRATATVGAIVPTFAGRGCYVVSATESHGR